MRSIFLFPLVLSVMLSSTSCMDDLETKIKGNILLTEGDFLPQGPLSKKEQDKIPFIFLSFKSMKSGEKLPLLVLLHGSGSNAENALNPWIDYAEKQRILILAPSRTRPYQNETKDLERLDLLIEKVSRDYPVEISKRNIAGISSGAMIARQLVLKDPSKWNSLILLSSPPSENWIDKIEKNSNFPPVLYVHGRKDEQFDSESILKDAEKLKQKSVKVAIIDDPDAAHEFRSEWIESIFSWIQTESLETNN